MVVLDLSGLHQRLSVQMLNLDRLSAEKLERIKIEASSLMNQS